MINHVLVFEDEEAKRIQLIKLLKQRLRGKATIIPITGEGDQDRDRSYDTQLEEEMRKHSPGRALVICDKELGNLQPRFIGLSGTTVASVADRLGLPLCLYARGEGQQQGEAFLRSLAPWEKRRIIVEFDNESKLAADCVHLFKGFAQIAASYKKLTSKDRATPARALSAILGKPEIEDRVALYGSGEQGLLEDIMPFVNMGRKQQTQAALRGRMPRILGNWLRTSILRFPGILVSCDAAASYLNISVKDFGRSQVQALFSRAKYKGPFAGMSAWWWRHELDDIVAKAGEDDGLALAKKRHASSQPCVDEQTGAPAGYYCMVTGKPVSKDNSKGGISWFPSGADLARIRLDTFNELAPWIGLY